MTDNDYDAGVRDTQIKTHSKRLDDIAARVGKVEKLSYMLVGAFLLIEAIPAIKAFL